MQIIGIYLRDGDPRVTKKLKLNTWYPFGNFDDCSSIFIRNTINTKQYNKYNTKLAKKQRFINTLYKLEGTNKNPTINLNCIVGMNGSGKSTLLALQYRIINNLACELKQCLPDYNQDYEPTWASGFNAELYYELDNKLYCIKITNNQNFLEENTKYINDSVFFISETCDYKTLFTDCKNAYENTIDRNGGTYTPKNDKNLLDILYAKEKELLNHLSIDLFYSIATNYSIYSNSTISFPYLDKNEEWLTTLYHKNDGYFTPIVLVPYKQDGSSINIKKELSLAKERVSTLSLLLYKNKQEFIEGFNTHSIEYELVSPKKFKKIIIEKRDKLLYETEEKFDTWKDLSKAIQNKNSIHYIHEELKNEWEKILFTQKKANSIKNKLKELKTFEDSEIDDLFNIIKENTLEYVSYKLIKMYRYYDDYKRTLDNKDIVEAYFSTNRDYRKEIIKYMEVLSKPNTKIDFTNLKIVQCINFLNNVEFYFNPQYCTQELNNFSNSIYTKRTITAETIQNLFNKKNLTYDSVFKQLLPAYFIKEFLYDEITSHKKRSLSSFSSGESQLLFSLSYAIYHMKNAASNQNIENRIQYKNMNLILDEAELYYHPEYQRKYISDLLGILSRSNLSNINSVNITIVTHSPFMLSDIPNSNITALENGSIINDIEFNTLGANIYDLLKNKFFMISTIGAQAEKNIGTFIQYYNNFIIEPTSCTNSFDKDFFKTFIDSIGDPYLHDTLKNMFLEIIENKSFKERKTMEYERKIKRYENTISKLKKEKHKIENEKN